MKDLKVCLSFRRRKENNHYFLVRPFPSKAFLCALSPFGGQFSSFGGKPIWQKASERKSKTVKKTTPPYPNWTTPSENGRRCFLQQGIPSQLQQKVNNKDYRRAFK
jgi:hypothetical protein